MLCEHFLAYQQRVGQGLCFLPSIKCGRSAFKVGFSQEGEQQERKEENPQVFPQEAGKRR